MAFSLPSFAVPLGLSVLGTAILDLTGLGDAPATRSIDPDAYDFRAQAWIEEDGDDELEITQHPVEQGAAISDHAYKRPPEVRLRVGWSNSYSGGGGGLLSGYLSTWIGVGSGLAMPMQQIYRNIVALQEERRPFTVYTGKRTYENMLVASIRVHNDAKYEHSFIADITFRKIILVSTQTTKSSVPTNEAQHADPKSTLPTGDQGPRNTTPASVSNSQLANAGASVEQAPSGGVDPVTGQPIGGGDFPPPNPDGGPVGPIDSSVMASRYRAAMDWSSSFRNERR